MSNERVIDQARYDIEGAIFRLMENGWDDDDIRAEFENYLQSCREDHGPAAEAEA